MTTAYTKTPVGNKLFVVSWNIQVDDADEDGEAFECADCELLSISSTVTEVAGEVVPKMYFSNFGAPDWYGWKISLKPGAENTIMIPDTGSNLPAPTRYLFPRLEGVEAEGSLNVVALFAEI